MISIIITSINPTFLNKLKQNIEKTIGSEYEFIVIDNQDNKYNIFEAYNLGVSYAKGDILCFAHEDILFYTDAWGEKVEKHFSKEDKLGMIGVVGGDYYPKMPAPWWNNEELNTHYVNLIQHWREIVPERNYRQIIDVNKTREYNNPNDVEKQEVVAVDGLWFCIRKELFNIIRFDDSTFNGFHFYDIDIGMQVYQKGYKIKVIYDVLIEHFSPGTLSKDWFVSAKKFSNKWDGHLPVGIGRVSLNNNFEIKTLLTYTYWMKSSDFSDIEVKYAIKYFLPKLEINYRMIDYWQLKLWSILGYQLSRIPMYLLRKIL